MWIWQPWFLNALKIQVKMMAEVALWFSRPAVVSLFLYTRMQFHGIVKNKSWRALYRNHGDPAGSIWCNVMWCFRRLYWMHFEGIYMSTGGQCARDACSVLWTSQAGFWLPRARVGLGCLSLSLLVYNWSFITGVTAVWWTPAMHPGTFSRATSTLDQKIRLPFPVGFDLQFSCSSHSKAICICLGGRGILLFPHQSPQHEVKSCVRKVTAFLWVCYVLLRKRKELLLYLRWVQVVHVRHLTHIHTYTPRDVKKPPGVHTLHFSQIYNHFSDV